MTFRELPNGRQPTTSLGFGCAYIVSGFEQRKSTRVIHAAFDAGLRHFDVAPSYGMGTAEDALGIALTDRRRQTTIASKAGLGRPNVSRRVMFARSLAAPLREGFPSFTRLVGRKMATNARGQFSVDEVERSLCETLRRLKTDYLDLLLLHEAQPDDISDELLRFLEDLRRKGIASAIGVASGRTACESIAAVNHEFFDVYQYSWSALDSEELSISGAKFVITHRAILNALRPTSDWLTKNPEVRLSLSSATGFDLSSEKALADVLLGAALAANSSGIVLAASRNVERVKHFGDVMCNEGVSQAGAKLVEAFSAQNIREKI